MLWGATENIVVKYRIGIINDYKGVFAFVDFQKYGITEILGAGEVRYPVKKYQESTDGIYIFLNFKQVAVVKSKAEAVSKLRKLIEECPPEARKDVNEYSEYLFRSLIN